MPPLETGTAYRVSLGRFLRGASCAGDQSECIPDRLRCAAVFRRKLRTHPASREHLARWLPGRRGGSISDREEILRRQGDLGCQLGKGVELL